MHIAVLDVVATPQPKELTPVPPLACLMLIVTASAALWTVVAAAIVAVI